MALILFPKLDKKSYLIIIFISFCWITYTLNDLEIKGILPYDNKLFDKICQFLIYIFYFIFLYIKRKRKKENLDNELLLTEEKKIDESQKFTKKNLMTFALAIFLDILSDTAYTIYYDLKPSYGDFIRINI